MNRLVRSVAWAAALGALPLVLALVFVPGRRALSVDLYLLLIAAAAVLTLVRAVAEAAPLTESEPAARLRRSAQRLPQLERTERAVLLSTSSAFDVHYRLRPILREIAIQRLSTRRGLTLEGDPAACRVVLGEQAWELVRPEREPPQLRFGPGIEQAELREVVDALERI
jgi:hypothetical protein